MINRFKEIPRHLALLLLTSGASLILGLLSFSGMLALYPVLPLALTAMVLSVAYEGEIYLQNIKGALNKLLTHRATQQQLGNRYLLNAFQNAHEEGFPKFFTDYESQLDALHQFEGKQLSSEDRAKKRHIQKNLRDMEKWFSRQLFPVQNADEVSFPYQEELRAWLKQHGQAEQIDLLKQQEKSYRIVKLFSTLAGAFMGLGSTYLLVEAFSTIPLFATLSVSTWPLFIVPMALIAGSAYGLLTYNAMTDMVANDTLRTWRDKIINNFKEDGFSPRSLFMAASAATLLAFAIVLTICTAGTWWTVAKEGRPLFAWMGKMPSAVMGVINPLITGLSAVAFNLQNTSESLEMIDEATQAKGNLFTRLWNTIQDKAQSGFSSLYAKENWLQLLNPVRLLLAVTLLPLRVVLFIGHLISIGVTADRVPGLSSKTSATLGIISEGFEDAHYFINPDEEKAPANDLQSRLQAQLGEQEHSHEQDLPTRIIHVLLLPLHFLAAGWDTVASRMNSGQRPVLTLSEALDKQLGQEQAPVTPVQLPANPNPSSNWRIAQALLKIERHEEKHLRGVYVGKDTAAKQATRLHGLKKELADASEQHGVDVAERIHSHVERDDNKAVYGTHRWFGWWKTQESHLLEDVLADRVANIP